MNMSDVTVVGRSGPGIVGDPACQTQVVTKCMSIMSTTLVDDCDGKRRMAI
jgi:hypothetical protein